MVRDASAKKPKKNDKNCQKFAKYTEKHGLFITAKLWTLFPGGESSASLKVNLIAVIKNSKKWGKNHLING